MNRYNKSIHLDNNFQDEDNEIKKRQKFISAKYQQILRLQTRLYSYVNNIENDFYDSEKEKTYCNIANLCEKLRCDLPKYLRNNGYNMTFEIEDEIFIIKISEKNFMLLNIVVIIFITKYLTTNPIKFKFFTDATNNTGIICYEFPISEYFLQIYKSKFSTEYLSKTQDIIDWIDLKMALNIANSNNSDLCIDTDSEELNGFIYIIINGKK